MANPTDAYTIDDVANWLGHREVAKAQPYLTAVADLRLGADTLAASVQGTAAQPYRVAIQLAANGRNFPRRLTCSCPVGGHCKHAAATLLAALERRGQRTDYIAPEVLVWLDCLRQAGSASTAKPAKPPKAIYKLFWLIDCDAAGGIPYRLPQGPGHRHGRAARGHPGTVEQFRVGTGAAKFLRHG